MFTTFSADWAHFVCPPIWPTVGDSWTVGHTQAVQVPPKIDDQAQQVRGTMTRPLHGRAKRATAGRCPFQEVSANPVRGVVLC